MRRLVVGLLEEKLGEDNIQLVTRYLVDPGFKRNYMPVHHAARESIRYDTKKSNQLQYLTYVFRFQVSPAAAAAVMSASSWT